MKIDVMVASKEHLRYVTQINDAIDEAAKSRGTGIVRRTDDAAAEKAVFLQQMAHDGVILVGVGPQVGTLRPAEGDDQRKNAL